MRVQHTLPNVTVALVLAGLCFAGAAQGGTESGYFEKAPGSNYVHAHTLIMPQDGQMAISLTTDSTLSFSLATVGFFDSDGHTLITLFSPGFGQSETHLIPALRKGTYYFHLLPSEGRGGPQCLDHQTQKLS
jgi:hypothetical protein